MPRAASPSLPQLQRLPPCLYSALSRVTEVLARAHSSPIFPAPARRLTAADDGLVLPAVSDLCARLLHDMGAEVALKRFTVSCLHTRTRSQWHTVGQWLCKTFELAPLSPPLRWTPEVSLFFFR